MPLILASTSPYRRQLLERLQIPFECHAPEVDEDFFKTKNFTPVQLVEILAREKAQAVAKRFPQAVVIGSDQCVSFEGQILGKPKNTQTAFEQLQSFANKPHELLTAVCVVSPVKTDEWINRAKLWGRPMSETEIHRYIQKDEPFNCAGSYKIESLGLTLFDRIETSDFTAITGLPLMRLSRVLRTLNFLVP